MQFTRVFFITLLLVIFFTGTNASEDLSPYYKVVSKKGSITEISGEVKTLLQENGFDVIGQYRPENKERFFVMAFTNQRLQEVTLKVKDRGILASIFRVGFVDTDGEVTVSIINPDYLFYGYLRDEADTYQKELSEISNQIRTTFSKMGGDMTPFGGELSVEDLKKYHYMMMMPYFDDPVDLNEFSSFSEGVNTIRKNLNAKKANTLKVYELILEDHEIAIFGVGLLDIEEGEEDFLPVIGESHIAAMPYEIILQGKEATMLHGKFRFALFWPELSLGEFMKISSTPGNVKDFMEALTE